MSEHVHCVKCGKPIDLHHAWYIHFTSTQERDMQIGPFCHEDTTEIHKTIAGEYVLPLPLRGQKGRRLFGVFIPDKE